MDNFTEGKWDLSAINRFEADWLKKGLAVIKSYLADKFEIEVKSHGQKLVISPLDKVVRAQEGLAGYFAHDPTNRDGAAMPFDSFIKAAGVGITKLICEKISMSEENQQQLQNFSVAPVQPFGIPAYETSFCACSTHINTPEGKHELIYPNLNTLTQEHIDLIEVSARVKGRPMLRHLISCLIVTSHEVLHFIQTTLSIKDQSSMSWSAEHDASWPSLSLLCGVERKGLSPIFTPGLLEACIADMVRR